jgi:hypothetical protein
VQRKNLYAKTELSVTFTLKLICIALPVSFQLVSKTDFHYFALLAELISHSRNVDYKTDMLVKLFRKIYISYQPIMISKNH